MTRGHSRVTVPYYPGMLTGREIYFYKFVQEKFFFMGYNNPLKDWSLGKQLILFPWNLNVTLKFSGYKINCLPRNQSLTVYY